MAQRGSSTHGQLVVTSLVWLGATMLAAMAYWAPWVNHSTAALKLSGQDLGEFVKFLPEIRRGQVHFPRQLFYLSPLACSAGFAWAASNQALPYPRWLRVCLLVAAALLPISILPPAWGHPRELLTPEFRLQALGIVTGLLLVLLHGVFRNLSLTHLGGLLSVVSLAGLFPAQVAFWIVRPRIWAAYDTPTIRLGWGLWLDAAAWAVAFAAAVILSLTQTSNHK